MSIFNKKRIKDFLIYGFGQAINLIAPLFIMPFIIYRCGQDGFGQIGVGFSMALILSGIVDYGSYINGVKEISINRDEKEVLEKKIKAIYLSKFILLAIVLSIATVSILFIPFFNKEKPLLFLSLVIVVAQFLNPNWFFQGIENFKLISIVNILSKIIYVILVLVFIKEKQDYIYANLFLGIGAIIGNLIGLYWLLNKFSFSLKNFSLSESLIILKNEFTFSMSQFFLSLYQYFPIILISSVGGDLMAGQFRVIDQVLSLFKTYLNMFFYFVYSNICFELNKDYQKGLQIWRQYNGLNFLILLLIILLFYSNSELILEYFKIDNIHMIEMLIFFKIGLIIPLLVAISQPLRQLMFAFNENKIYIRITIIMTLINLILLFVFTTLEGLCGAFLSIIFIEIIIIILYCYFLRKHLVNKI